MKYKNLKNTLLFTSNDYYVTARGLSRKLNLTKTSVYGILKVLKENKMIEIISNNDYKKKNYNNVSWDVINNGNAILLTDVGVSIKSVIVEYNDLLEVLLE